MAYGKFNPRLLVMSATGDSNAQYITYMNMFFTNRKLNIPLVTCMILHDSELVQQCCDITGGLYVKVDQLTRLLQYLTWLFLPKPSRRKILGTPPPMMVDNRDACFCLCLPPHLLQVQPCLDNLRVQGYAYEEGGQKYNMK